MDAAPDAHVLAGSLAVRLHGVLLDLNPGRWRREHAPTLRKRLAEVERRFREMLDERSHTPAELRARLHEIVEVISGHLADGTTEERRSRWMRLRRRLSAAYAGLAIQLRDESIPIPVHRPANYFRNGFHIGSAAIAVACAVLLPETMVWVVGPVCVLFWVLEGLRPLSRALTRFMYRVFQYVAHPHEAHRINSATWYATSLTILAAIGDPVAGAAGVAVLGLGDPAAGFVGRRFGRRALVHGRTLEGSAALALAGAAGAFAILTVFFAIPLATALVVSAAAGIAGALGELACGRRFDDNLVVPLAAAAVAWATLAAFGT